MTNEMIFTADPLELEAKTLARGFRELKEISPNRERQLERSLERYGQMHPVIAGRDRRGHYELIDGFKRVHVLERAKGPETKIRVRCLQGGPTQWKAAMILLNWGQRSVSVLEEALVLHSMEEDGLKQKEIGVAFDRDKSWVSRRIALVKRLDETVKEHLSMGLIHAGAARELALLPRGNQPMVMAAILENGLTMREIEKVIKLFAEEKNIDARSLERAIQLVRKPTPRSRAPVASSKHDAFERALGLMRAGCDEVVRLVGDFKKKKDKQRYEALTETAIEAAEISLEALQAFYLEKQDENEA